MKSDYRLGIDAGGTFTDFVLADKSGQVRLFKALSTRKTRRWRSATALR